MSVRVQIIPALLLLLVLSASGGEAKKAAPAKVKVKVTALLWSPSGDYAPLQGVRLYISRGKKEVIANRANGDSLVTITDKDGLATFEFNGGTPVTLVSDALDKVAEVVSLASSGKHNQEVALAIIAEKDFPEFLRKNPGATRAFLKFQQAANNTPRDIAKDPNGKDILKNHIEGYKKTRPTSSILTPCYYQRTSPAWKTLVDSAGEFKKSAPITAIVKWPNAERIASLKQAGIHVLGFVDTGKGIRMKEAVVDVKRWYAKRPTIDGIYLDNQSSREADVARYADLAKQIRSIASATGESPTPVIIGNCGKNVPPSLFDADVNHATCCYQSTAGTRPEDVLPDWIELGYANRAAVLMANVKRREMESAVRFLLRRGLGYCYCTDLADLRFAALPTPGYWHRLLEVVAEVNEGAFPDDDERKAAQYVLSIGGVIEVWERGGEMKEVADLPASDFTVKSIVLVQKTLNQKGLALLARCSRLAMLRVDQCKNVTEDGLASFSGIKTLIHLGLDGTRVTNEGLRHFKDCVNLDYLGLYNTEISDAGIGHLSACTKISKWQLGATGVTDKTLKQIMKSERLEVVSLYGSKVSADGVKKLKEYVKKKYPKCEVNWK